MQSELNEDDHIQRHTREETVTGTLYGLAMAAIRDYIQVYLALARQTNGFTDIQAEQIQDYRQKIIVIGGIDSPLDALTATAEEVVQEWHSMRAVPFEVELAITKGVYIRLRSRAGELLDELQQATNGFLEFDPAYIRTNPYILPILQRLANISSKAELKRRIGSASDNSISTLASERLAQILNQRKPGRSMGRAQLLQSIEPTLEGIVRDLVGRVLLESIVANALDDANVLYKRESEYRHIPGVVYDFRADFVIPDDDNPKAFIEVRKSSTRHASLYAKDKMFSAINWKGKNKSLLAVLVVDGPWTSETLRVMTRVFDYVVPLNTVPDVANVISAYVQGDRSKLKWLIDFSIQSASG